MQKPTNIIPFILAGGLGTRLGEIAKNTHKVMLPIHGKPFVDYLLGQLRQAGFDQVILCTGHLAKELQDALGTKRDGISIQYSFEPSPLGTGGALRLALGLARADHLLVLNGDSYCEVDLKSFCDFHLKKKAGLSIVGVEQQDCSRFGTLNIGTDGRLVSYLEKTGKQTPGSINAGVYLINRKLAESIPPGTKFSMEYDFFPKQIGHGIHVFPVSGRFIDIGTPESYREAQEFFRKLP